MKFIQAFPLSSESNKTLSGEIVYSHSGAPEDMETDKFSTSLFGFWNSITNPALSPGKISTIASSAIIIPIVVLLEIASETLLFPCETAVNTISLNSSTTESAGAVILNSASTVLNAPIVIEPEGELSILIWEFQSLVE